MRLVFVCVVCACVCEGVLLGCYFLMPSPVGFPVGALLAHGGSRRERFCYLFSEITLSGSIQQQKEGMAECSASQGWREQKAQDGKEAWDMI